MKVTEYLKNYFIPKGQEKSRPYHKTGSFVLWQDKRSLFVQPNYWLNNETILLEKDNQNFTKKFSLLFILSMYSRD
jgi:hypothetical protein